MKILTVDIETSPCLAHVWKLFKQNIGINQILDSTEVLCWAAKWQYEDEVMFMSKYADTKDVMIERIWTLLDECDAVVHYNGQSFDIPHLNREFLELGLTPPSSYKQIDLYRTVKSQFNFPSNKMDYVVQKLGIGKKVKHEGHELWVKCIEGDPVAWETMKSYNIEDVKLTEALYARLLPWIKGHPNVHIYENSDPFSCPRCGHWDTIRQGYAYTPLGKFQQRQCKECGGWFRERTNLMSIKEVGSSV